MVSDAVDCPPDATAKLGGGSGGWRVLLRVAADGDVLDSRGL